MDCSKFCVNFEKKCESPFPGTLRTKDLHKGMLVEDNHGSRYVILAAPTAWKVRVLSFRKNYASECSIFLSDHGCQPNVSGNWNQSNWLREVE